MKTVKSLRPSEGAKNAMTGKGANFKGEAFPGNINSLLNVIRKKCRTALSDKRCFTIGDIFHQDKLSGRILVNKGFLEENAALFNQPKNEIRGLYLFCDKANQPLYVGISSTVKRRLRQHFFGTAHNQASLVYLMGKAEFRAKEGSAFSGRRASFPFVAYGEPIQEKLKASTKIRIIPIEDIFELALSEIYYACYYRTPWNTFAPH